MSSAAMLRTRGKFQRSRTSQASGFTLIELLTVIAIIGILAAILIPTTASVRVSAKRARTKVTFAQWAGAMELFRMEYGFYPEIDGERGKLDAALFAGALTGKTLDGASPAETNALAGNSRALSFYTIQESELDEPRTRLADAFGNTDIAVLYDKDGDGRITASDGTAVGVRATDSDQTWTPATSDLNLSAGLRAGVIFYSAGRGTSASDMVLSWK